MNSSGRTPGAQTLSAGHAAGHRASHSPRGLLRDRCRALGLPVWRCDNSGLVLSEPEETGPLGLLFSCPVFLRLIGDCARNWGSQGASADGGGPEVTELFPGCWAMPLEELHRRQRTGFTVMLALGPECLNDPTMTAACGSAQIELTATRKSLLSRAHYDLHSARTTRAMLLWMMQDLTRLAEHEHTSTGFTRQLTDCYETIDLLYALGRSMNDLTQPEKFIARLCERVRFTLNFGWVGVYVPPDARHGAEHHPARLFAAGALNVDQRRLEPDVESHLAQRQPGQVGHEIFTEIGGQPIAGSGQILLLPIMRAGRPMAAIMAGEKSGDDPQVSSYDIQLLEAAAGFIGAFLDNAALYADQQALFLGTLEALTAAIDAKDRYTCGHSQRVAHLAHQLALATGMSEEDADRVRIAGLVHDVGKIGVPEAVLCKSGKLTDEEFDAIKKHPEMGHRILKDIALLQDVLPGVLYHHERFDGRGYPHKLAAHNIPLMGRIIAIADTFDAMSSTRSYRAAMPRPTVLAELQRSAGTQLDPDLVQLFVRIDLGQYDRMVQSHAESASGSDQSPMAKAA